MPSNFPSASWRDKVAYLQVGQSFAIHTRTGGRRGEGEPGEGARGGGKIGEGGKGEWRVKRQGRSLRDHRVRVG